MGVAAGAEMRAGASHAAATLPQSANKITFAIRAARSRFIGSPPYG
jgi:hypothetical protein